MFVCGLVSWKTRELRFNHSNRKLKIFKSALVLDPSSHSSPNYRQLSKKTVVAIIGIPEIVQKPNEVYRNSQILRKMEWVKEDTIKNCMRCNVPFTALRRKHHCRVCTNLSGLTRIGLWQSVLWLLFISSTSNQRSDGTCL